MFLHQSVVSNDKQSLVKPTTVSISSLTLLWTVFKVVIGPNASLPEGTVVSMHHPDEEKEEEDDDKFLSDDAEVGHSKDKTKLKGVYWLSTDVYMKEQKT